MCASPVITTRRVAPALSTSDAAASFSTAGQDCEVLLDTILDAGGKVPKNSPLELSLNSYRDAATLLSARRPLTDAEVQEVREGIRVRFTVRAILEACRREVPGVSECLKKIRGGEDIIVSGECGKRTNARDTAWELVIAGLCSTFATDVELIDPPDLTLTYRGQRWSIAAKMLCAHREQTRIDRVVEGAEQIESYKDAEHGLVLVNVTDTIHHEAWRGVMPLFESVPLFEAAMTDAVEVFHRDGLFKRLSNRPKARTLFVFGQSLLDDGSQAMLITSACHASGIPHSGDDRGEASLVAEIRLASEQLAKS